MQITTLATEFPLVHVDIADYSLMLEKLEAIAQTAIEQGQLTASPHNNAKFRHIIDLDNSITISKTPFRQIFNTLLSMDTRNRWITADDTFFDSCLLYTDLVVDMPGFKLDWHIDNRAVVVQGVINITKNDKGTKFRMLDGAVIEGSGKRCEGTFWLNTENSIHGVSSVGKPRVVLLCTVTLPVRKNQL